MFNPCVGKTPWRRKWQPTPVLLPGNLHGQRSLVGYSPWGGKESDTTKEEQQFYNSCLELLEEGCGHKQAHSKRLHSTNRYFVNIFVLFSFLNFWVFTGAQATL